MEPEPTHPLSEELVAKLIEAKGWHERRATLEANISTHGGPADRNQEDRDLSDREGALILNDIIQIIDHDWGFGPGVLPEPTT